MVLKRNMLYLFLFLALITILNSSPVKGEGQYDDTHGEGKVSITLATGSPGSLGLLKAIAEPFCDKNECRINWIKRGSGASLKALKSGEADVIMVHAPDSEKKAVSEGWAEKRTLIGGNEFYVVGPDSDPAGIKDTESVADAYSKIAASKSLFFTRNDNSGTHKKELMIWEKAGIKPQGSWYVATNDFMGPTLMRADQEKGYFMTDSSTYFVKQRKLKNMKILFKGDPVLINVYHALGTPKGKKPEAVYNLVTKFIVFLKSEEGQKIITDFGKKEYGAALYVNATNVSGKLH